MRAARSRGWIVEPVGTPAAALERVVGSAFDAVLLDPALGDDDDGALALLHRLRTVAPDTVVVIWSEQPTVEFTVRAMRAGALDVLKKIGRGRGDPLGGRARDRARRARARGPAAARRGREGPRPRRGDRRVGADAPAAADDRARRRLRRDRADRRRERHRQGAARAHDPPRRAARRRAVRRVRLLRARAEPARGRAVRPREGRVHRRRARAARACSARPTAARSSSTRSATSTRASRTSCCACFRSARSSRSVAIARSRSTCAWSRRPTRISRRSSARGQFREDLYWRLAVVPDPGPAAARAQGGHPAARRAHPREAARRREELRRRRGAVPDADHREGAARACRATAGRATSASSRTCCRAPRSCATAR